MTEMKIPDLPPWRAEPLPYKVNGMPAAYVADRTGAPVVAGPLPMWLARLIAAAPDLFHAVESVLFSPHTTEPVSGDFEYDLSELTVERLERAYRDAEARDEEH